MINIISGILILAIGIGWVVMLVRSSPWHPTQPFRRNPWRR